MISFYNNKINYKKFINHLCDYKALELDASVQQIFLNLFLSNFRFLSLSNQNGFYFLRQDLLGLPEHSLFLRKSGLARAQLNQLNDKYTTTLVSTDYRTFQYLNGLDLPQTNKMRSYSNIGGLLAPTRGLHVSWNDGALLKHLLVWEHIYAPGLLMLKGFSTWHAFFMKEKEWFFFSSWAKRDVNYILMLILLSRGFSQIFNHYMPDYVISELHAFLKQNGPLANSKGHLVPFYMWVFDVLRWSSILAGGKYTPVKVVLEENNKLRIKEYLYDNDIINFGGWMQTHKDYLIDEVRYWVYPEVEEFKNEELFQELIEMEDVYDSDVIDDDAFIASSDVFVWPWTKFWDQYYALNFVKSKKFFQEVNDVDEHKLLLSFYFSVKNLDKRLESTPTSTDLLTYFEQTFKASAWDDVIKWLNFFYPKTFNTVKLIGFNRYPLLLTLSSLISYINGLFLYGFQGFDRRNIFFRLFFFVVLKHRGFCFKWFSILLKRISYRLPWEEELTYILHLLEQDQIFFHEVCKKKLYTYFYFDDHLLKIKQQGNQPFLYFFQFFFANYWDSHVRQKRKELYPDFLETVENLLFKNPSLLNKYTIKVIFHVYFAVILDFFKNPMFFIKYLRLYEAKFDKETPSVFNVNLQDYGKQHKGGSYYKFFKYRRKFESLLKETVYKNKNFNGSLETDFNKFFFQKNFKIRFSKISKQIFGTILNLFIYTYKQFYVYALKVFIHSFHSILIFFLSGFMSATAYQLSGYFLKFFNPYSGDWPLYKAGVKNVFQIGLRKELKAKTVLNTRRLFFQHWWVYLSSFREVFTFKKVFFFFIKVCWFYTIHALHRIFLNLYKVFWHRAFVYRRWIWRIKNTARLRFYDWSPDLDYSIWKGISKEHKIIRAKFKSEAKDENYQPKVVKILAEKISEIRSPFEDELWKEIHQWLISLFFYRKLRRKSVVYKKELTYMFGAHNTRRVVNTLLNFKFWSFFFTYIYLFLIRSAFLTLIFSVFFFFSVVFNLLSTFNWIFYKKFISSLLHLFGLQLYVILYSIIYGIFWLSFYSALFFFFFFVLLFKIIQWLSLTCLLIVKQLGLLMIIKPFFRFFIWVRLVVYDIWLTIRFNYYWILIFLLNWWSFVRFVVILTLGFLLFLAITLWYTLKGLLFVKTAKKDYSTTLFFFFKEESSIFYYDFKDFLFFLSFFAKCFCLIISFFMFVFGQMGWKLVKFIFGEGYESDALKIKPELPTKKVFQFLDLYVWLFFYTLKDLCLTKPALIFFLIYSLTLEVLTWVFRFLGGLIFLFLFLFNFIIILLEKTNKGASIIQYFNKNIKVLHFGFMYVCLYFFTLLLNFIQALKKIKQKKEKLRYKTHEISFGKLVIIKFFFLFFNSKTKKILMNSLKLFSKTSKLWPQFLKKFEEPGMDIKRELQEVVVFISIIYEFSAFYWSYIQKLSIEVGELGWWLSYYDRTRVKIYNIFKTKPFLGFIPRQMLDNKTAFFSKDHSYYLHINSTFAAIQRYRPYIINKIYVEKVQTAFGNQNFLQKFVKAGSLFKSFGSFTGLSFLFEILFLRFQQPISLFLFGNKKKIFPAHVLIRLKYFKDFFSEFNWLVRFTYDSNIKGVDNFFIRFLPKFFKDIDIKTDYLHKHRSNWFYKIFTTVKPRIVDLLPKFRWNYSSFLTGMLKWLFVALFYIVGLMITATLISFIIHFCFFFLFFYSFKLIVFWIWSFFKQYWWFIVFGSFSFLIFILYILGFIFF